jgi:sugar phosphate isomerase/epimerase
MIASCVTIALVEQIKTGPWIFWEDLEGSISKAAGLGFDAIELFTASADAVDPAALGILLSTYNLKLAAVGTGAGKVLHGLTLTDPDEQVRNKAISFVSSMIEFGARFGAPVIIGSMQGNVSGAQDKLQAMEWLAEGLHVLGKQAEEKGVVLIYEPLNRYETNLINTLEAGAQFIETHHLSNVKLLADLFHMNIEESNMAESIQSVGHHIGHVHFADSNRRAVGYGHTDMGPVVSALKKIGYHGFVSAEAFPWPDQEEAAAQTLRTFKQFFSHTSSDQ